MSFLTCCLSFQLLAKLEHLPPVLFPCLVYFFWCDIVCQHDVPTACAGTLGIETKQFNVTLSETSILCEPAIWISLCMLVDGCFYNLDVLLSAPYKVADETPESSQSHDVIINSPIKCIASKQKTPFPLQRWDILPNGADTERPLRMS